MFKTTSRLIVFLIALIGIVGVIAFDVLCSGRGIIGEGFPESSVAYIIRSIVILIATFAMFWSLIDLTKPAFVLDANNRKPVERVSILLVISISSIFSFLLIFSSSTFNILSLEDGIVEWASAIFLFASSIIIVSTISMTHRYSDILKGTQLSLAIFSLIFFVIAMEELSWLQRVFEIETPEALGGRKEMNFHNLATNKIENIYYFGAFVFLVLLPFFRLIFPFLSSSTYLKIFVPRPFIAIMGAIACAYNYDMWNIVFIQITFFGSVAVLVAYYLLSSHPKDKLSILFIITFIILTQLLFLFNGINYDRRWEVTEYKEFFIPFAFFIYAVDLFFYIRPTNLESRLQ